MLPKHRRLTTAEVAQVLKSGRSKRATYISIKILQTETPFAVSVVVSKAVARKAVERNTLRRTIYRILNSSIYHHLFDTRRGRAVLFVQKVPTRDVTRLFSEDVAILCKTSML